MLAPDPATSPTRCRARCAGPTAWDMTRTASCPLARTSTWCSPGSTRRPEFASSTRCCRMWSARCATTRAAPGTRGWARLADAAWRGMDRAEPRRRPAAGLAAHVRPAPAGTGSAGPAARALRRRDHDRGLPLDLDARWRHPARRSPRTARPVTATSRPSWPATPTPLPSCTPPPPGRCARPRDAKERTRGPSPPAAARDGADRDRRTPTGFWHHAQTALLEPYVPRYFAALDEIWTRHAAGWWPRS